MMFANIAYKIKMTAKIICVIGIGLSCIIGFSMLLIGVAEEEYWLFFAGMFWAVVGSISSWVGSFTLYGFGQLIDNTDPDYRNSINHNYRDP